MSLIDRWQDACFPGQDRPFRLDTYQNDDAIWLADSRQGGAKLKISKQRMEADIVLAAILKDYDSVIARVGELVRKMRSEPRAEIRHQLGKEINELDRLGFKLRGDLDAVELLDNPQR
jgi:hypothetical protein